MKNLGKYTKAKLINMFREQINAACGKENKMNFDGKELSITTKKKREVKKTINDLDSGTFFKFRGDLCLRVDENRAVRLSDENNKTMCWLMENCLDSIPDEIFGRPDTISIDIGHTE